MSQSAQQSDSQALLQSMLQRLKLQPGREGQTFCQAPVSPSATPALGQNGERGASSFQNIESRSVNVFNFNGNTSKEFTVPAVNSNSGFESYEKQQASPSVEGNRSPTFFPSQKVSTDGQFGEKKELGQTPRSGFSPTGTRQLFPVKPQKDVKLTFFKRTDAEKESIGSSLMTGQIPADTDIVSNVTQNQNQIPLWSVKGTDIGGGYTGFHVGNGGIGSLGQNKDVQVFSSSQITTNTRRRPSSENKTRRWTQKIKERFKDRHGNAGKKGKEERCPQPETQIIMAGIDGNKTSNETETTFPPSACSDSNNVHPAQAEDETAVINNRRSSDVNIGLGSFNLLDEIVRDNHTVATFINPNQHATSVTERPSVDPSSQPHIQPNPSSLNQSPGSLNQAGLNHWSFRSPESSQSAPTYPPRNMDPSALKQQSDQSEPMEDGQSRSEMLSKLQLKLSAFAEPSGNPYHSIVRNRLQMSRKRQHQPADRREERLQTENMSDGENTAGILSSSSSTNIQLMEESVEPQHANISPSHEQKPQPTPLSPTSFNPSAPPPRSVLRHGMMHDAESSMETLTKRRRVEEKRRVHFCEQVVTIASPDMEVTDSEEDSAADEDSLFEPDYDGMQGEIDEALPARRSNLPAWIKALKKMNAGKKHR
ncbi:uncharacterized protein LOC119788316 [Cyprinodon tularosa]|uniref:uncharacterized protein LOC119788316 n=1 Tax=Cyprinodon tularosa TaxID=77115 RepID=UPI0018E24430|nr:uncharacterized protein LOC119788316 [Cyprinodon tularosa]